ncbi:electron transfer flavoprotein subunit beta/FixA family protein [Paraburkholderia sp.]|uniref:electron transfer flavoprotein subunit beta/FixA family protein n=1 Tax=Paraburkholderia sp. TaxID=1926495 RepID=UPI003C7D5888
MKIVVCVRHIYGVSEEFQIDDAGTAIEPDFLDVRISEWDQAAVEAALRIRDAGQDAEIVLVSIANSDADPVIRRLLAMGADRARRIEPEVQPWANPLAVARILADVVREEAPDMVLSGVLSADQSNGATGIALAGYLDWPSLAAVKTFELEANTCVATCELEGGLRAVYKAELPVVLSIQTGAYQPRYANIRSIKQAEQKELSVTPAAAPEVWQKLRRLYIPEISNDVQILGNNSSEVANRILEIVRGAAK